ncbi:MAG TPA: toll/interleukin-1 receptor domain-containing protein [Verrucomicrobiae bacterium]|nr:toll/interleukin-1 receptor domain-containing protein [Verrucomicrobiae bacterium]
MLRKGVPAWNDWRIEMKGAPVDLTDADLRGLNLQGIDFTGVVLDNADFSPQPGIFKNVPEAKMPTNLCGADFSNASLRYANLEQTNLIRARFDFADLAGSNLYSADLTKADLGHSWLLGSNFSRAVLEGTSFKWANLGHTIFALTSLKTAEGLDGCDHYGPSSLDFATLMASGTLPEVFLRGCGLPDEFINFLPSFRNDPIQFFSCFISYSHADKSFARRLHDALQGRGIRCWLDEHQILPGDKIHHLVDEGIRQWDKVLLCCSEHSLKSWWVDKEVEKALMKEEKLSNERGKEVLSIIPLNLDGFMFNKDWTDWKQQHLISRHAPDFSGWDKDNAKFERELEKVIKALRADAGGRVLPPTPRL